MKEAGVYLHRIPETGRIFYVGYTSNINGNRPYHTENRNKYWSNTYFKHGRDVEIIATGSIKDMLELEEFMIAEIGLDNLCNMTTGGEFNILSPEVRVQISNKLKGNIPWNKGLKTNKPAWNKGLKTGGLSIIQYSIDGEEIAEYKSSLAAQLETNIQSCNINRVCNGRRKTAGGFIWKFKN
jgi:hypothetical protein